jgi:predicted RNA binding protein YcfA (HicA-like mRNA interferase family)
MKRRDLEQHLRSLGCLFHHHGGRHDVWLNPQTRQSASVPRHKEIKTGLARGICRELGIEAPLIK